jgi:hypothetical protein
LNNNNTRIAQFIFDGDGKSAIGSEMILFVGGHGLNNPSRIQTLLVIRQCAGSANSDPECPAKPPEKPVRSSDSTWEEPPSSPDEETLNKVRELALGDETLILAWLWLYNIISRSRRRKTGLKLEHLSNAPHPFNSTTEQKCQTAQG